MYYFKLNIEEGLAISLIIKYVTIITKWVYNLNHLFQIDLLFNWVEKFCPLLN